MPLDAFALALGSAFLHALWNLILGRERDPEAATAIALVVSIVVFAPVAVVRFDAEQAVWPYVAVTAVLQLLYFGLLATAYRHGEVSVVYPIARGFAPVIVLVLGVTVLGSAAAAAQVVGICLVGVGVLLVRGLGSGTFGRTTGAATVSRLPSASRPTRWSTRTESSTPTRSSTWSSEWSRRRSATSASSSWREKGRDACAARRGRSRRSRASTR